MRCFPLTGLAVLSAVALAGCAKGGALARLPDPVFPASVAPIQRVSPPPHMSVGPITAPARATCVPQWMPPGGISRRWECIVFHHSGGERGCAEAFDRYHRRSRGWDELGYHFVIGNGSDTSDGQVEVGSRWRKQKHGAHCKTPNNYYNDHGIGICLVGDFAHHAPSARQLDSAARLVDFLMAECGIDVSAVHTHCGVTSRTACPGRRFSLGDIRARLRPAVSAVNHGR